METVDEIIRTPVKSSIAAPAVTPSSSTGVAVVPSPKLFRWNKHYEARIICVLCHNADDYMTKGFPKYPPFSQEHPKRTFNINSELRK